MSRATVVYIIMLIACTAGVWGILEFGTNLSAPKDLTGVWDVGVDESADREVLGERVNIEQSGQFVRLNFKGGLVVDLRLVQNEAAKTPSDTLQMTFEGDDWKLVAEGANAEGPLVFDLKGPQQHKMTVTRHVFEVAAADPPTPASTTTETADAATHAP